ncbi:MAG: cation:proton antiporter [Chloroflexi bacterium]|nr:cation:proton antiporter [Chloroflexota bacterium]
MPEFLTVFGVIAVILTVTALASGLVQRSLLSFPLLFLTAGIILGKGVLGVFEVGAENENLEIVATLTLSLVLFLDAVRLDTGELGRRWLVPVLVLGPGTVLIIALGATSLALILGFGWLLAFIGGSMLASTDPVVLREIVRDERIPRSIRQILTVEAGTNDLVVLPVILVLIAVAGSDVGGFASWVEFAAKLALVGPLIGFAIGGVGSWLIARVDAHMAVRREYQALYGIGIVLAAYTAATAAGGDGFLAAFAAGLGVVLLNQTLCDCFIEYGEITSEMAMLLAFVLFGSVLSGILDEVDVLPTLLVAAILIFLVRPGVLGIVLARAKMSLEAHAFVSWFGPRGLNSLLLALLVVQAGIDGAELLLATVGLVVLASTVVHGATATTASGWYERRAERVTLAEEREGTAAGLFEHDETAIHRITPEELRGLLDGEEPPPLILDVRSPSSYERDGAQIPGSVRVPPDRVSEWDPGDMRIRLIVAYCT